MARSRPTLQAHYQRGPALPTGVPRCCLTSHCTSVIDTVFISVEPSHWVATTPKRPSKHSNKQTTPLSSPLLSSPLPKHRSSPLAKPVFHAFHIIPYHFNSTHNTTYNPVFRAFPYCFAICISLESNLHTTDTSRMNAPPRIQLYE